MEAPETGKRVFRVVVTSTDIVWLVFDILIVVVSMTLDNLQDITALPVLIHRVCPETAADVYLVVELVVCDVVKIAEDIVHCIGVHSRIREVHQVRHTSTSVLHVDVQEIVLCHVYRLSDDGHILFRFMQRRHTKALDQPLPRRLTKTLSRTDEELDFAVYFSLLCLSIQILPRQCKLAVYQISPLQLCEYTLSMRQLEHKLSRIIVKF